MPGRLALAAASGLLLVLAFEPVAAGAVVPVALLGFGAVTRGVRVRAGFGYGLVFGACFYFPHIWWMKESNGLVAWLALAAIEAAFLGLAGAGAALVHRLRWWPVWVALVWTAVEVTRSEQPFSGMPWGRLGFAAIDTPFAPLLTYVGITGVTLVVVALSMFVLRVLVTRGAEQRLAAVAALVVAGAALLPLAVPYELPVTGSATVAAVQGNVPGRGNDVLADPAGLTRNHVDATLALAADVAAGRVPAPDFVLWPENSTARDPFLDLETNAGIREAVAAIGVPVVVGGLVDDGPDHVRNQGIVWDPVTGPGQRYTKWHPVTMGEYIPWRPLFDRLGMTQSGQLARIPRDMRAGDETEPLRLGPARVADAICFDVAYDNGIAAQIENGADLLAVQTSNATFIFTGQVDQQFALTRARAVESGKTTVVASTNGISGIIAADGTVLAATDRRVQEVLVDRVPLRDGVTPGTRMGMLLRATVRPAALLVVLVALVRRRRERRAPDQPTGHSTGHSTGQA